ncbi:MAG TPA: hypothetical protein VHD14_06125 [Pseudolabrys sp.]|nr:hypothetical protein [Pseudolabrys sp.]
MKDTRAFVRAMRRKITARCDGLSGKQVIQALFRLTDEMWAAGIDDAWDEAKMKDRKKAGDVFCITWLTLLATRLEKLQARKR